MIYINLIRGRPAPAASRYPSLRSWLPAALAGVMLATVHIIQGAKLASLLETRDRLLVETAARAAARGAQVAARSHPVPDPSPSTGAALSARRLRHLAATVPAELWLVGYRERETEITIEGISRGDDAPHELASKLSASEGFGAVEITEMVRRDKSDLAQYAFTLVATTRRPQGTPAAGIDAGTAGD